MRNKIKNLLLLLSLTISQFTFSANVGVEKAQMVAVNFARQIDTKATDMSLVYAKENAFYIWGYKAGFIIVSADDRAFPILGYSTEGSFRLPEHASDTSVGNNFWGTLKSFEQQIQYVVDNNISATDDISTQWSALQRDYFVPNDRSMTTVVPPLLTTTWDQGWPYNSMCPVDP